MKTLIEIIEDVKDGVKPEYDDLRYALLAMCALRHFDNNALYKLWNKERNGKYKPDFFGLEWEVEESFKRTKSALNQPPKLFVGETHDPDIEECQKFRKFAKKILEKAETATTRKEAK